MPKRRPGKGGADQLGGDRLCSTKFTLPRPHSDELTKLRALHLMQTLGLRPELALMIAAVAYRGGR